MKPYSGNAAEAANDYRGWFLGHFIGAPGDPGHSEAVEIKWGRHAAGEMRAAWSQCDSSSLAILIRGRFVLGFEETEFVLQNEGDFVFWGPGIPHTWRAVEESLVITVRWPSGAADSAS